MVESIVTNKSASRTYDGFDAGLDATDFNNFVHAALTELCLRLDKPLAILFGRRLDVPWDGRLFWRTLRSSPLTIHVVGD